MPRAEAEGLALQWKEAKRGKDYATADGIRSRLRAVGIEAEDLAEEIEIFGLSERMHPGASDGGEGGLDVSDAVPEPYEPDANDPLAYRDHRSERTKALFAPTEAAARHKDGGTGGLLTLNYSLIPDLPENFGFTVTAGKAHANEDALTAYKQMKADEEEAMRKQVAERNAQTRMRVRPSA